MTTVLQAIGVVGASLIIGAYFGDQRGWLQSRSVPYLTLNLMGSLGILASLVDAWNLPSAVIEGFWLAISLYGLARTRSMKTRVRSPSE